jgi:hypothetical protein
MSTVYDGKAGNITTESPLTVTGASNTNPIVITVSGSLPAEFYTSGGLGGTVAAPQVDIAGVVGNTAANGIWPATPTGASTFSIPVAGNGVYVTGGTVQPLYLKSLYNAPSDGDLANEASVDTWIKATGDRCQFLASRLGAYKWGATLAEPIAVDDPTAVAQWTSAAVGSINTDTALIAWPPTPVTGVVAGDLAEVFFRASTSNNWPGLGQVSLRFQVVVPGAGSLFGSTFKVPFSGVNMGATNIPFTIHAWASLGFSGLLAVGPSIRVPATTGTYGLWGDALLSVRIWRPTGMPQ